jgi:hypothetical protein
MGWSSGSTLIEELIQIIDETISKYDERVNLYTEVIKAFENYDADGLDECVGSWSPAFDEAYYEVHPDS